MTRPNPSNLIVLNAATWARGEWDMFDVGSDFEQVDHYNVRFGKDGKDQTELEVTGTTLFTFVPFSFLFQSISKRTFD